MPALPGPLARAWRALERFADGPRAAPSVFLAALGIYAVVSLAVPLGAGRDLARYLLAYVQLFDEHVIYPHAVLTRTPGTPLVAGALLEAGPFVAEAAYALLYAASVLAWFSVARRFGPAAALTTAVALLVYPGYVLLFHRLSSDALFAAGFAFLALLVARAREHPSAARSAALGAGVAGLVLIRPVAQALLLLVFLPLLASRTWRARIRGTAALAAAALVPLVALAVHNHVRLDDFTVVRGGSSSVPLFRAFVADRIVQPENGSASRELARVVARDLLPKEPYRSYEIDLERFFSSGSFRMHEDLIGLADRTWGWDDDYRQLGRVGREAVLSHPWTYTRGVAGDFRDLLVWPLYLEIPASEGTGPVEAPRAPASATQRRQLPTPSEGEPIPASRVSAHISTPDGRIREVWTSPTDHRIVFRDPRDAARAAAIDRRIGELLDGLGEREGSPEVVRRLNDASRWYPRPVLWLLAGMVAFALRRPRGMAAPLVLSGAALLLLLSTALAVYAVAEYAVPVVPAFILLATAAALGRREPREPGSGLAC